MPIFRWFEGLLEPTKPVPGVPPVSGLIAFYWHYARQARGLVVAMFAAGCAVALLDSSIPAFIGQVVTLLSTKTPATLLRDAWPQLAAIAAIVLIVRPIAFTAQALITNQAMVPGLSNLSRWQNHWHVVRQSWTFFQNDFAGRIANRVMQTGPSFATASCRSPTPCFTSSCTADPRSCCSPTATYACRFRSCSGSAATRSSYICSFRRCASVRARHRKCARC